MGTPGENPSAIVPRIASKSDLADVTETLAAAFGGDPLWRWAFPDAAKLTVWWRFIIEGALRYRWVWTTGDYSAASVWIPPGGTELAAVQEARVVPLLEELAGERASAVIDLLGRFDAAHPKDRQQYYLSLLGTSPTRRGRGLGMALLSENLRRIDEEGMPAYLESSNPTNDSRYARAGFARLGEFSTPDGKHTVTTMWREGQRA